MGSCCAGRGRWQARSQARDGARQAEIEAEIEAETEIELYTLLMISLQCRSRALLCDLLVGRSAWQAPTSYCRPRSKKQEYLFAKKNRNFRENRGGTWFRVSNLIKGQDWRILNLDTVGKSSWCSAGQRTQRISLAPLIRAAARQRCDVTASGEARYEIGSPICKRDNWRVCIRTLGAASVVFATYECLGDSAQIPRGIFHL